MAGKSAAPIIDLSEDKLQWIHVRLKTAVSEFINGMQLAYVLFFSSSSNIDAAAGFWQLVCSGIADLDDPVWIYLLSQL